MGAGWGDREAGVAWCDWSGLARDLSARSLAGGASEAVVFHEIDGEWTPKARRFDWSTVL